MLRVDEAVAYFEAHNPENSQLNTLGALRREGQLKLEEEFRMVSAADAGGASLGLWDAPMRLLFVSALTHKQTFASFA
jgi:hypothetical protein